MSSAAQVQQRLVFKEGCPALLVHVWLRPGDKVQSPDLACDWPAPGALCCSRAVCPNTTIQLVFTLFACIDAMLGQVLRLYMKFMLLFFPNSVFPALINWRMVFSMFFTRTLDQKWFPTNRICNAASWKLLRFGFWGVTNWVHNSLAGFARRSIPCYSEPNNRFGFSWPAPQFHL